MNTTPQTFIDRLDKNLSPDSLLDVKRYISSTLLVSNYVVYGYFYEDPEVLLGGEARSSLVYDDLEGSYMSLGLGPIQYPVEPFVVSDFSIFIKKVLKTTDPYDLQSTTKESIFRGLNTLCDLYDVDGFPGTLQDADQFDIQYVSMFLFCLIFDDIEPGFVDRIGFGWLTHPLSGISLSEAISNLSKPKRRFRYTFTNREACLRKLSDRIMLRADEPFYSNLAYFSDWYGILPYGLETPRTLVLSTCLNLLVNNFEGTPEECYNRLTANDYNDPVTEVLYELHSIGLITDVQMNFEESVKTLASEMFIEYEYNLSVDNVVRQSGDYVISTSDVDFLTEPRTQTSTSIKFTV